MGCYFGLTNKTKKHNVSGYWKSYGPTIKELKRIAIIFGWNLKKDKIVTGGGGMGEKYRYSYSKNKWINISMNFDTGEFGDSDAETDEDESTDEDEESSEESSESSCDEIKSIYDYESSGDEYEKKVIKEESNKDYEKKLKKVIKQMKKMGWTEKRINKMTNVGYDPTHNTSEKQNVKKNIEKYKLIFDPIYFWN